MAIQDILIAPDPRLKLVSTPVEAFDGDLRTLVADMFETMYAANGIGLAAIQIGVDKRVVVIDLQPEDPDAEPVACAHDGHEHTHQPTRKEPRVFVNPELFDFSEELATYQEGCLVHPGDLRRGRPPRTVQRPLARSRLDSCMKKQWTAYSPPACSTKWTT
jgi:peptide deformylase